MANEVTTSTVDDLSYAAAIFNENIIDALYEIDNVTPLIRIEQLGDFASKAMDFPKTPKLAAASLAEGVDMAYTPFATSKATITASESGIALAITDVLSATAIVADSYYSAEAAKAVANKRLTDITALASGFSQVTGTTTVNLTELNIQDAITTLQSASVPGPYLGVLHPQQVQDLVTDIGTTLGPVGSGGQAARSATNEFGAQPDGSLGMLYGINWRHTAAVPTANAGADRLGMIVSPQRALGMVEKWASRTEMQRDATLRAIEIVITANYGLGEIDDTSGVGVLTDA